jgi:GNAT superfamily N-acetyltransferase
MGRDIELRSVEQLAEIGACHSVMMELRPHLKDAGSFVRQVMRQREHGYRLSAAWHADRIVGVIGYRFQENLLYGRFVFVDDLVVHQEFRRDGVGARLLSVARAMHGKQPAGISCSIRVCTWRWPSASIFAKDCSPMPWAFPRHSLTPMAQCHSADASVARLAYRAQKFDCAQASPRPVGQGTLTNISGALVGMRVM